MQGNCRAPGPAALRIVLSLSLLGKETSTLSSTHRYQPATVSFGYRVLLYPLLRFVPICSPLIERIYPPILQVRIIAITYCLDSKPYHRVFALKTIEGGREAATLPLTSERGAHSKNHTTRRELDSLCAVAVTRWKVRTPRWRRA